MLTPLGWGILGASILFAAAGGLLGYPEMAALGAAGLLAVLVAVLWTISQPRLAVRREVSPLRVPRGDPAIAMLSVTNQGRRVRSGMTAHDRIGDTRTAVELPSLGRGASRTISYQLPTQRRGEYRVGPLRLVRVDPFGLVRRERGHGEAARLLVRPRTVALPTLPSGRAHNMEGAAADNAPQGTVTFHTLREYVRGDDLRHVHWRSSARHGTLLVKHLIDIALPHTTILLDMRTSAYASPDDLELAVDAAASAAVSAAGNGFPTRIMTNDGPLVETQGDPEPVLDALTLLQPTATGLTAATGLIRRVPAGGTLVVIAGTGDDLTEVAGARKRHSQVVFVRVVGQNRPPPIGYPGISVIDITRLDELAAGWAVRRL